MKHLEEMNLLIYETQQELNIVIEKKRNLLDLEVISISQKLDCILNKYNSLIMGICSNGTENY